MSKTDVIAEITAVLDEARPDEDGRVTFVRRELETAWGLSDKSTLGRIRTLVEKGILRPCQVRRRGMHSMLTVKGYEYIKPEEA